MARSRNTPLELVGSSDFPQAFITNASLTTSYKVSISTIMVGLLGGKAACAGHLPLTTNTRPADLSWTESM
jgi:hypothetical protein